MTFEEQLAELSRQRIPKQEFNELQEKFEAATKRIREVEESNEEMRKRLEERQEDAQKRIAESAHQMDSLSSRVLHPRSCRSNLPLYIYCSSVHPPLLLSLGCRMPFWYCSLFMLNLGPAGEPGSLSQKEMQVKNQERQIEALN